MKHVMNFEQFLIESQQEREMQYLEETTLLDVTHLSLDLLGLVPGWGEAADFANAVLYIKHKEYLLAALSIISLIPAIGDLLGKSTKFSLYLAKYAKKGATLSKIIDIAKLSASQIKKIKLVISTHNALIDRLFDEIEKSDDKSVDPVKPHVPKLKKALVTFAKG